MQTPAGPKGTRDFFPEEMAFQEHIFSSWHKTCRRFGFEQYEAPMFESLELYTQKSGSEIEQQLYTFADKKGRALALRPELTPSLARMVAARGTALKRPIRWYALPRLFRYEKMQKGRLREFFQLNMDILGIAECTADAELIAAVVAMMCDLGFTSADFTIHLSSRKLLEELFVSLGIAADQLRELYALLDKRNKIPAEEFSVQCSAILPDEQIRTAVLRLFEGATLASIAETYPNLAAPAELAKLFELLTAYGIADFCAFDISVVRGLAYYTGIVFEVFDKTRELRAIAGGGRYDNLVKLYGGPDTPAVGFAAGDVVLAELMRAKGIVPKQPPRSTVFIASFSAESSAAICTATMLRSADIACEFALKKSNIGKQLDQANAARVQFVVFVGGAEEAQQNVKIKNMTTGSEETISRHDLVRFLKHALNASPYEANRA